MVNKSNLVLWFYGARVGGYRSLGTKQAVDFSPVLYIGKLVVFCEKLDLTACFAVD